MSMLFNDIVRVIDQGGTIRGQIGAVVGKNSITTQDASVLIEVGDTIERDLPMIERKPFWSHMSSSTGALVGSRTFTKSRQGIRIPCPIDLASLESRSMLPAAHTLA